MSATVTNGLALHTSDAASTPAFLWDGARELTGEELALIAGGFGWGSFFRDVARDTAVGIGVGSAVGLTGVGAVVGAGIGIAHGLHDGHRH